MIDLDSPRIHQTAERRLLKGRTLDLAIEAQWNRKDAKHAKGPKESQIGPGSVGKFSDSLAGSVASKKQPPVASGWRGPDSFPIPIPFPIPVWRFGNGIGIGNGNGIDSNPDGGMNDVKFHPKNRLVCQRRNAITYRTAVTMITRHSMTLMARAGTNFCALAPQYIPAAPPIPKSRPSSQSGPTPIHE